MRKPSLLETLRKTTDDKVSKPVNSNLWKSKLSKLERALLKHDFPKNMSG